MPGSRGKMLLKQRETEWQRQSDKVTETEWQRQSDKVTETKWQRQRPLRPACGCHALQLAMFFYFLSSWLEFLFDVVHCRTLKTSTHQGEFTCFHKVNYYYYYYYTSVSIPKGGIKIDENDWKGMMLSPCSQGPAGCRVAEQHWNAAPAPKLADTND